jgi:hypothetical protein
MRDVVPFFDAGRMADEYYEKLYNFEPGEVADKKRAGKTSDEQFQVGNRHWAIGKFDSTAR